MTRGKVPSAFGSKRSGRREGAVKTSNADEFRGIGKHAKAG